MELSKKEYARKEIYNGCLVQIENSSYSKQTEYFVTRDNCSVSFSKPCDADSPNNYTCDRIFNPHLTTIKDSCSHIYEMKWSVSQKSVLSLETDFLAYRISKSEVFRLE